MLCLTFGSPSLAATVDLLECALAWVMRDRI